MSERIAELEIQLTHQQRYLDELNSLVYRQQQELDRLATGCRAAANRAGIEVDGAVWHFGLRYTYVSDQEKNPTLIAYIEIVGKLLVVKTRTHEHRFCIDGDEIVALKPKMLNGHNCHSGI